MTIMCTVQYALFFTHFGSERYFTFCHMAIPPYVFRLSITLIFAFTEIVYFFCLQFFYYLSEKGWQELTCFFPDLE